MKQLLWIAIAVLGFTPAGAEPGAYPSAARILADMAILADDRMEGRRPGTAGEKRTIRALIEAFKDAGLEPAGTQGWLQPVMLEERKPRHVRMSARRRAGALELSGDVMLIGEQRRMRIANAPVRFVDHAETVPPSPGAVLLYHDRSPPGTALAPDTDDSARHARLAASGAAMTLAIVDPAMMARQRQRMPLGVIEAQGAERAPIRGYITEDAAKRLLAADAAIDAKVTSYVRRFRSANVIGRLRGAREPDRALLYLAHWDGFGRCRPGEADAICNGGIDNASGVAGMIELARWFAAGPRPDRTILFVASTAEEYNLLGTRAYADRPVVPLADTVAAINIDTIALYPAGQPAGYVGARLTDLDPLVTQIVGAQGRTVDMGEGPAFVAQSSDAWPLLRAGVPSVILSGVVARTGPDGGAAFRGFITRRAHLPVDDMRDIELGGAIEDLRAMHALGSALARRGIWPDFLPGARFSRPRPARNSAGN